MGSRRTPVGHRNRLRAATVELEVVGADRVDLPAALARLHEQRGIRTVRVHSGPGLNVALLRAGLVDEISILLAPYLVGSGRGLLDGLAHERARPLQLVATEPRAGGHVCLRYTVADAADDPDRTDPERGAARR